jgi:hypothetical protein
MFLDLASELEAVRKLVEERSASQPSDINALAV